MHFRLYGAWCAALLLVCSFTAAWAQTPAALARITAPVAANDPGSRLPQDWHHGALLQVYVRGYQDSDDDGIGDLRGVMQRLDYIASLGVSGIWLMPITRSQDNDHGYAVVDYRDIEPEYGSMADFEALLEAAHQRGLAVVLDYVINHSSIEHPLFEASRQARRSPWRDWYVWADQRPEGWNIYGKNPWYPEDAGWYFAGFSDQMPEFNLRNPAVVDFHLNNLRFWLNKGVDGFRFDAVGNLFENGAWGWEGQAENHALMAQVRSVVDGYANRFMVCEAPGDALAFGAENSCGASFAFGHNNRIIAAALGDSSSIEQVAAYFLPPQRQGMVAFASNHDSFAGQRLMDRVRGDMARYRLAAATYLLQSPSAVIYYGEEIGMAGGQGLGGDHRLRPPMSWDAQAPFGGFSTQPPFRQPAANWRAQDRASQEGDPVSLLHFYRRLLKLRNGNAALRDGRYEKAHAQETMMAFVRSTSAASSLVVLNYGKRKGHLVIKGLPAQARLHPLWDAALPVAQADRNGQFRAELAPLSFEIYSIQAAP